MDARALPQRPSAETLISNLAAKQRADVELQGKSTFEACVASLNLLGLRGESSLP